ncbi:pentatricopeptide repeat-containing protein 2, mitochondrial [Gymnodraco acuticeps]|uniref:Pentatricopeptide repeat-containing protein 2, mitochondrial n=1 Tax=Gymnodraco acuticeps TaxID=8218 RepID=A0A6P8X4F7_GYMAC|nr:pentatricopeptide repeat-containing protein 2, mitochondrial [Gymnodraco acuticeps]
MMALARIGKLCRSLVHEPSKGLFVGVLQPGWIECCTGAKRHLLSQDVIKLQEFQKNKLAVAHLLTGAKGNYIELFSQKLQRNDLILRDELKRLLHMCQSADDMVIARDAISRYHADNRNLMFGDFRFGPLFVRLCYELGMEDLAAATIMDKSMSGFFSEATSFNITLDMLFTKGYYENCLEVLTTMRKQPVPFNINTLTLASATFYKLNTEESYRMCTAMLENGLTEGMTIPRHALCFAVALALRQNDIEKAQSLFSKIMIPDSLICRNLKVMILAMSGEVTDVISLLSAALTAKSFSFVKKPEFSQEVVDLLRLRIEGGTHMLKVEQIVKDLEQADQVTQQTVDGMLCHTPTGKRRPSLLMEQRRHSRSTQSPRVATLLSE